jgi:uncharacterized membrane protein
MNGDITVTPGRWIRAGWDIVRQDLGTFVLMSMVMLVLVAVGNVIVVGPLMAGMFVASRRQMQEGKADLSDLFSGFQQFVDTLLIGLILSAFTLVGFALCIFPALVVLALYLFSFLFHVDRKLAFWDALEASRRLVVQKPAGFVLFVVVLTLLNLLGLMLAVVGVLFTIPITIAAITVAYRDMVDFRHKPRNARGPVVIP